MDQRIVLNTKMWWGPKIPPLFFKGQMAPFQGILGFSMAQYASPRAQNGLKTLV